MTLSLNLEWVDPEVGWDDPPYLNIEWVDPEVGRGDTLPEYRVG
jgi:hypothetical protein